MKYFYFGFLILYIQILKQTKNLTPSLMHITPRWIENEYKWSKKIQSKGKSKV